MKNLINIKLIYITIDNLLENINLSQLTKM